MAQNPKKRIAHRQSLATVDERERDAGVGAATDGASIDRGDTDPRDDFAGLPRLLTVEDVAHLLRLTPKGIYSLIESRRIPFVRTSNRVRFLRSDVVAWLRENRVPAIER